MRIDSNQKRRQEISMVPLINVVFLLLIFFLVAGTAIDAEEKQVALPESLLEEEGVQESEVTLTLTETGRLFLNGSETDGKALDVTLKNLLKNQVTTPVTVRVAASVPASRLIKLLRIARQAGAQDVFIATKEFADD